MATQQRFRIKKPALDDFTRLNKVVLKDGATNAAANRALRANHDMKVVQKASRNSRCFRTAAYTTRSPDQAYGRPNRPQTPVQGVIHAEYTARSEALMRERYEAWMTNVSERSTVYCSKPNSLPPVNSELIV